MTECEGCGAQLAPSWKYCIHCGLATSALEIPAALRPSSGPAMPPKFSRVLILCGVGIFLVGIGLIVVTAVYLSGGFQ
jgi:hypothetical protein